MENKKQTQNANSSMEKTNHGGSHVQSGSMQRDVAGSQKGASSAHKGMDSEKTGAERTGSQKGACSDKECAPTKGVSSRNGSGTEYKK